MSEDHLKRKLRPGKGRCGGGGGGGGGASSSARITDPHSTRHRVAGDISTILSLRFYVTSFRVPSYIDIRKVRKRRLVGGALLRER